MTYGDALNLKQKASSVSKINMHEFRIALGSDARKVFDEIEQYDKKRMAEMIKYTPPLFRQFSNHRGHDDESITDNVREDS